MTEIYLSLGSNVGDRRKFLKDSINELKARIHGIKVSSVYQTEPWGKKDQPEFLNICISGQTDLTPEELLDFIKLTETKLGRKHTEKWGPREIDIDILFYGQKIIKKPEFVIPHPHLAERAFVLVPLCELAPNFPHPVLKQSMGELAERLGSSGVEKAQDEKL